MFEYDVRKSSSETISKVVFSECTGKNGFYISHYISKASEYGGCIKIWDNSEYVLIESAEHARNLKKALDKAIELGWLK